MVYKPFGEFGRQWAGKEYYLKDKYDFISNSKRRASIEDLGTEWEQLQKGYAWEMEIKHLKESKINREKKEAFFEPFGAFGRKWISRKEFEEDKKYLSNRYSKDFGLPLNAAEQMWVGEQRQFAQALARKALQKEAAAKKAALMKSAKSKNQLRRKRLRKGLHLI